MLLAGYAFCPSSGLAEICKELYWIQSKLIVFAIIEKIIILYFLAAPDSSRVSNDTYFYYNS
jgi:hypothetical protein